MPSPVCILQLDHFPCGNGFIAGVHGLEGGLVPAEVDEGGLVIADIIHKLVDQTGPLVKVGILNGVAVIGTAVVIDVGAEAVGHEGALFAVAV